MSETDVVDIQRRARELGPWVNGFEYGGVVYPMPDSSAGGAELAPRHGRAQAFFDVFPNARRILELGSLEGADTVRLARVHGTDVVGVEGRAEHIDRARFVADLHGLSNVTFVHADVESFDLPGLGSFDAVLCAGLLYHLQRPWDLLATLGKMSNQLFLSTHYWAGGGTVADGTYTTKLVHEDHPEPRTRALAPTVRWFNRASLLRALRNAGFDQVTVLDEHLTNTVCDIVAACHRSSPAAPAGARAEAI